MRQVPDTFCLSDTAKQPLSRLPATVSTASNVVGGAEREKLSNRVAVGAGLATAAAGKLATGI